MDATIDAARIRAEAIREFAEELKARSESEWYHDVKTNQIIIYRYVVIEDIDDLVVAMTGKTEGK